MSRAAVLFAAVLAVRSLNAQPPPPVPEPVSAVRAVRAASPVAVDGRLDEPAWASAPTTEGFRQSRVNEGDPSRQRTVVRILYDDDALYVGARMYDTAPDSVVSQLSRRDVSIPTTDEFAVYLDPYHDRRSGYFFAVNVAGTLIDGTMSNDGNFDFSWDGVWTARPARDAEGWTAEIRVPFSQLRFTQADVQTWGVNFQRVIARHGEDSFLRPVASSETGFVSHFRDLTGIERIRPPREFEAAPYVTSRAAFQDGGAGNPFNDGSRYTADAGADVRVGLSSNLRLTGTVNPDFGQVEVDPAVVNLSGFEVFFPERRPFFVEGASVFDGFGSGGSSRNWGFNWVNNSLFYSRRVGRAPQGSLPAHAFADPAGAAAILGAAKVTGRVGASTVGIVSAFTERGVARIAQEDGAQSRVEVEPLAHYGVARTLREFGGGRHGLGALLTTAHRFFGDDRLRDQVNGEAYAGGVDGWLRVLSDQYVVKGFLVASHVAGTPARIGSLQQSSVHFLQRPDRQRFRYDPARTSLTGTMGRVMIDRLRGEFVLNAAAGFVSPTFDSNDAGFIGRTDVVNAHIGVGKQYPRPYGPFQRRWLSAVVANNWDFDGNRTGTQLFLRTENLFRNFWSANATAQLFPGAANPTLTRGGPLARSPFRASLGGDVSTDSRRAYQGSANGSVTWGRAGTTWSGNVGVSYRPLPALSLSASTGLLHNVARAQYVRQQLDPTAPLAAPIGATVDGAPVTRARYVFAEIDQWELATTLRVDWTFTPTTSLQLFAQPLVAAGDYRRFGELAAPNTFSFARYGEDAGAVSEADGRVTVDADGSGPAAPFSFGNPDFRFVSLRGNAVFRWEYRPGSTLFFVWTQLAEDVEADGAFGITRPFDRLLDRRPDNVFAVKLTYWLSR